MDTESMSVTGELAASRRGLAERVARWTAGDAFPLQHSPQARGDGLAESPISKEFVGKSVGNEKGTYGCYSVSP